MIFFIILSNNLKSQKTYIEKYQLIADSLECVYEIPSSVMLAIGFYESAGGKSKVALLLNNHFGIVGPNNLMETHKIYSRYRYFNSVIASYEGFCKLVTGKKFYSKLKGSDNSSNWVYALHSVGYASSGQWPVKINKLIKNYNID
jgi:flagellum-specific peptidoglycan hydrolase FlgJ